MVANRIKGITVEIGGDTTKLQTALKGVNTEIRNTQSQLRDVEKLLKLDPGNMELLGQRSRRPRSLSALPRILPGESYEESAAWNHKSLLHDRRSHELPHP